MDVVPEIGNDVAVPWSLSWLVWGAVVVAGSVLSFEVWKQALEPTPEAVAPAPQIVAPSVERSVPATVPPTPSGTGSNGESSSGRVGTLFGGSPVGPLVPAASGGAAILLPVVAGSGTGTS